VRAPLLDPADPLLRDYLDHDLDDGRVRLSADAVLADATDVFLGASRWRELDVPTELVRAEWSTGRDSAPAYSDAALAEFEAALPCLRRPDRVPGVDHAAVIMTRTGAAHVADALGRVTGRESAAR
jgi:hypothetical protein